MTDARSRSFGEVLTPEWMVKEMLSVVELNSGGRVLDLCAGPGAFLSQVLKARLEALYDPYTVETVASVLTDLYAFELLEDNVEACKQNLLTVVEDHVSLQFDPGEMALVSVLARTVLDQNIIQMDVLNDIGNQFTTNSLLLPVWDKSLNFRITWADYGFFKHIISNPPYQKNISGSDESKRLRNHSKSTPIYNLFFDFARSMKPQTMSFILPAKWYTGGWGLDAWRQSVLDDRHIKVFYDYRDSNIVFPGTEVNGGVCWMLWDKTYVGEPQVVQFDREGEKISDSVRPLKVPGADFFIRDAQAYDILKKVGSFQLEESKRFSSMILGTTPFGFNSNFSSYSEKETRAENIKLFYIKKRTFWVKPSQVKQNREYVDQWKVFISLSYNQHSPQIMNPPVVFGPGSTCTHSYLAVVGFSSQDEAESAASYMRTKFFRFLAHQLKISPIATKQVHRLAPVQDWNQSWSDEELYKKYGLNEAEVAHIEKTITSL